MQGYTWGSNQRPSQRYQDRPSPQYQERLQPPYHEHFPPNYHAVRNDQPSAFQVQLIPQLQQAANQWSACSGGADFSTFQQNSNGYDWLKRTNQIHPQHQLAAARKQQHYTSDNPNAYKYHAQCMQWHDSSPQNYRNTGYNQAPVYWSPQSDRGSSVGNSRGWSSQISNNGSSCSMNNQQQLQAPRMAAHPHYHQQQRQQQEFSRQYSGQKRRRHKQYFSRASQKIPNNQAQSRTEASLIPCNLTTLPSGAQSSISLPFNNLMQSPVAQNRPELGSNAGPDVSATQPQNNQNAGHQSQGTNNGTCNVNQTSQTTQSSEAMLQPHSKAHFNLSSYADTVIYRLLCSNNNEKLDERSAHQNTRTEQSEVSASKSTDNQSTQSFSEPRAQCTVEPPSKRIKYAVIQKDCWNKVTMVSKDKTDFGVQSAQTQTSSDDNRHKGMSQHKIQYSTDPADCFEVCWVCTAQQGYKAIAIVPPISQQISNLAPTTDTSPKKAESPLLKIDCVWSLVESNEQKTENDQLFESSSQMAQQDSKSFENTTESKIADPEACSASPVECQNDLQQSDCDSSYPSFDLSSVPVVENTLEKLMDLAKSLEKTELSAQSPVYSENVYEKIMKLYWNGNASNMLEPLKTFGELSHLAVIYAKDYGSVVFKSIETENLKKLAHCDILKNEMYSSSEEFRSSWLNVDGQPADIEKVLSETLLDDADVFKATSQICSDSTVGVNSLTDMRSEVSSKEKSVNPHTCSPTSPFIQKAGNGSEEVSAENNGHSYVVLGKESEKEAIKKQEDINQNQNFNTEPSDISPFAERSTEKLADLSNAKEVFRQDHKQTCDNASDSLSLSPGDSVSDGVKNSEVSFSTETHCTSMGTWQVEDISDDENPGNTEALNNSSDTRLVKDIPEDKNPVSKEALNNSSDTRLVEDISDDEKPVSTEALNNSSHTRLVEDLSEDENPVSKEALNNSSETCLVEDISDDENPGNKEALNNTSDTCLLEDISDNENSGNKEVLLNCSNTWQVEDISDNENPGNMDASSNSLDLCAVEDVSADEDSSEDSLFMGITVLSMEDAQTFFQEVERVSECNIKTESQSNFERPDLVAFFDAQNQPNHKYKKANACSRCGTEMANSSSTNVTKTDSDADLFCQECWEQAPLFQLEEEPNEVNLHGSAAKPKQLGQNYSLPCLKLEVSEPNLECIAHEGLKGQKSDCLIKSKPEENCSPPSHKTEVKESTVASNDECNVHGLAGQKSAFLVISEQGHSCSPPSVELKDKKPNIALSETRIVEEELTEQKKVCMAKSDLVEKRSRLSLKLEIKEPTVASTKECSAGQGQKSDTMIQSELRQNCSPPSVKLKIPTVSSPEECIPDERLRSPKRNSEMGQNGSSPSLELLVKESNFVLPKTCIAGQKSDCMGESELGQNCSPQSLKLEVKEPTVALAEDCIADKGLMGPNSDSMVKSVTKTVSEIQGSAERELTKIQPSLTQCRKPFPKKTAFSKNKLKSASTSTGSDESALFTPDIVVKKNCPQKKKQAGLSANKRHCGESQNCSKVKKFKEHRQERHDNPDRTSTNHGEDLQKVTEKVSCQSNDTPPQESEKKPELHGILLLKKIKINVPKKVRFDLYGSKTEKQYNAPERRFSAPPTLTVSDCKDYTDAISAKQKVLNQWSSTFIPKATKTCPPRSPQEGSPQKKKPQKPQDLLKSNMSALKSHLTHRAKLLSSSESNRERSHFRKPFFHQELRKTLSS